MVQKRSTLENQMELRELVKKVWKLGDNCARLSFFQEIVENAMPVTTGNFQKYKPKVWVKWKAPIYWFSSF